MANLVDVVAIAADFGHGLALTKDNIVWGWGQNDYGQLGDGTTDDQSKPMQVAELSGVTAIAAGFGHSLALKGYGSVWAWGANSPAIG